MKITITAVIDADVEGWARSRKVDEETAKTEILEYLRDINPVQGQTYLTLSNAVSAEQ